MGADAAEASVVDPSSDGAVRAGACVVGAEAANRFAVSTTTNPASATPMRTSARLSLQWLRFRW